jgi:hypothetical protein
VIATKIKNNRVINLFGSFGNDNGRETELQVYQFDTRESGSWQIVALGKVLLVRPSRMRKKADPGVTKDA